MVNKHAVRLSYTLRSLCGFKHYGTYVGYLTMHGRYVIVIPWYEYDIVVITRVRGEAEYEC